jgi:hypothetical protein
MVAHSKQSNHIINPVAKMSLTTDEQFAGINHRNPNDLKFANLIKRGSNCKVEVWIDAYR